MWLFQDKIRKKKKRKKAIELTPMNNKPGFEKDEEQIYSLNSVIGEIMGQI